MPFRFAQETVLRYRRGIEHEREMALQKIHQSLTVVDQKLQDLERTSIHYRSECANELRVGLHSAELHFDLACHTVLQQAREQLLAQRNCLQQERTAQIQALTTARRNREILETLRSQALEAYQLHLSRLQQRLADEQFLLRRFYLRHG